jgi:hypothetical protein
VAIHVLSSPGRIMGSMIVQVTTDPFMSRKAFLMMKSFADSRKTVSIALVVIVLSVTMNYAGSAEGAATDGYANDGRMVIPLTGAATGGQLIIAEPMNRNMRTAVIETRAGESAQSVAARAAAYIDQNNPFEWGGAFVPGKGRVMADGGTIRLPGLGYVLAGTERGLGIPVPPHSVSCTSDSGKRQLVVRWENPSGGYDKIAMIANYADFSRTGGGLTDGNSTSYVFDLSEHATMDTNDLDIWVIGMKNGLNSSAGGIHVTANGRIQQELLGLPFADGVSPNWQKWSYGTALGNESIVCRKNENYRDNYGNRRSPIKIVDSKPYKQVLRTPRGGTIGIWRQFLGLVPGHTYRISARLNVPDSDPNEKDWSFSLHAVPDRKGAGLSAQQMGGLAALPDGKSGPEAGAVVRYGPGMTTKGKYEMKGTSIVLPAESSSITVWLRLSGRNTGGVEFD